MQQNSAHRSHTGSPGKKIHRNGDARLHPMAAHPNGSQMIVESTVKGLYKVPIPDPAQPRNCQCSKVLGTIHRSPGHTTFSQVVRIGRFKFPWNPKRIKNTNKLSCTSTKATPTLLIDRIKRPLQHLQQTPSRSYRTSASSSTSVTSSPSPLAVPPIFLVGAFCRITT